MLITSKLKIDFQNIGGSEWVHAMQEDTNTRCVELQLFSGGQPWALAAGTTAAIGFKKPDGTAGLHDKLPDGTAAITLSNNTISVILVPQMLTVPGLVRAVVTLYDARRNQLSTFPFHVQVEENPAAGKILSENYCYYTSVAEINEALNAALSRMEETVSTVETKMENGAFNGKSAYEYARDAGYTDTEEAFSQSLARGGVDEATIEKVVVEYLEENPLVSGGNGATFTPTVDAAGNLSWKNDKGLANPATVNIKGPKGDTGATGPQGLQGAQGPKGETGSTGPVGPQGEKGDTGVQGPQGLQGPQGPQGPQGETGPRGPAGADGTGVTILGSFDSESALHAAHPTGNIGDSYLVGGYLYVWSDTDKVWANVGNIQGPKGETGPQGPKGETGAAGPQGETGPAGPQGATGPQGSKGEKGDPGEKGAQGIQGEKGDKGDKGDKGNTGAAGYSPVRGTDYWTASDIAQIKSYVDDAILGGAW